MTLLKRKWWNWQTHHLEGVAPKGVGVQIPPSAPIFNQLVAPHSLLQSIERSRHFPPLFSSSSLPTRREFAPSDLP